MVCILRMDKLKQFISLCYENLVGDPDTNLFPFFPKPINCSVQAQTFLKMFCIGPKRFKEGSVLIPQ